MMALHMLHRHRIIVRAFGAALLTAVVVVLWPAASGAAPSKSQTLFRKALLDDAKTTNSIKGMLNDRTAFVAPEIEFSDLTGDGRSDAVVLVETGGVAGAVALYVFSTHGRPASSNLRVVYRSQRLYRASQQISEARLIVQTPRFARGDDVCCPAKISQRTYSWSDGARTLVRRSSVEFAGPT